MKTIKISLTIFLIIFTLSYTLKAESSNDFKNLLERMNKRYAKLDSNNTKKPIDKSLIEGPFGQGDPVHEILTSIALSKYNPNVYNEYYDLLSPSDYEYIRGVIWNDDPQSFLFDGNDKSNKDMSTGIDWLIEYCDVMYLLEENKTLKFDKKELTKRSHFGDLQFFHAMASHEHQEANQTREHLLTWLSFLYTIITSEHINNDTSLQEIKHPFVNQYFQGLGHLSLHELFGKQSYANFDIKKRAMGSFLHVIQDSYFPGHIERIDKTGKIIKFLNYANQNMTEHSNYDTWQASEFTRLFHDAVFLVKLLDQSEKIIQISVELLHKIQPLKEKEVASWKEIEYYINKEVFAFIDTPQASSAGNEFDRKQEPISIPFYCFRWPKWLCW